MREFVIEIFVALKGPDLVALTARDTLWHELGYKERLIDINREDHFSIKVLAKEESERNRLAKELVEGTRLFVNPNKHTFRIDGLPKMKRKNGLYEVAILVNYIDDPQGRMILDTLLNTYRYKGRVVWVESGVIWMMLLRAKEEREALGLAEEITLMRSIKKGLLVNPYSQRFSIKWCRRL